MNLDRSTADTDGLSIIFFPCIARPASALFVEVEASTKRMLWHIHGVGSRFSDRRSMVSEVRKMVFIRNARSCFNISIRCRALRLIQREKIYDPPNMMAPSKSTNSMPTITDIEKNTVDRVEHVRDMTLTPEEAEWVAAFPEDKRKRILRKVDVRLLRTHVLPRPRLIVSQWRLVPVLLVLYLLSFIDRANIGSCAPSIYAMSGIFLTKARQCKDRGDDGGSEPDRGTIQYCSVGVLHSVHTVGFAFPCLLPLCSAG